MNAVLGRGRGWNVLVFLAFLVASFLLGPEVAAQTPTGRLLVTVVNTAGEPIEGARIFAAEASALSDLQGRATLVLPAGRITIRVELLGYSPWQEGLDVPAEGEAAIRVAMALLTRSRSNTSLQLIQTTTGNRISFATSTTRV